MNFAIELFLDEAGDARIREIWERIRKSNEAILEAYSVADLLEREPQAATGRYTI